MQLLLAKAHKKILELMIENDNFNRDDPTFISKPPRPLRESKKQDFLGKMCDTITLSSNYKN